MCEYSRFDLIVWNTILFAGVFTVFVGVPAALILGVVWLCQHVRIH